VALGDGARDVERQLGVRAASDGHDDTLEVADAALLDDGDVARRLAEDLLDRRGERAGQAGTVRLPAGRLAAPAEDDEVGLELRRDLDDALGGVPPDPDDRVDAGPLGDEVEHLLEQPASVPSTRGALGQGHALGHLDDAQGGELAAARVEEVGAEADELLRGCRVGDRDDDPGWQGSLDHDRRLTRGSTDRRGTA
jgi:hypothetical protein